MRAQIQTAVSMILTITIVAATLALGTWGFLALTNSTSDVAYTRITNDLDDATASHRSFGSRAVVSLSAPEPFCVFNLSAPADCVRDYSGYEQCEDQLGYWEVAGPNDGNVQFESGRNERIDNLYPENGKYACFTRENRVMFIKGQGSYITASPMREIDSVSLSSLIPLEDDVRIRVSFYTSHPQQSAITELMYVHNESAVHGRTYESMLVPPRVLTPTYTLTLLRVVLDPDGVVTSVDPTPNGIDTAGIEIPQRD